MVKDSKMLTDFEERELKKEKLSYKQALKIFLAAAAGIVIFAGDISAGGKDFKDPVIGIEMVYVKGGCFQMGDTFGDGESDEKPVHKVCMDDFYIGRYEVTVGAFRKFVNDTGYKTEAEKKGGCYYFSKSFWTSSSFKKGSDKDWRDPGFSQDDKHPVACVSWNDADAFTNWLSKKTGKKYRLPTEAEWEYAAKSRGKNEKYAGTSSESEFGDYVWYAENSGIKTHPVGQKKTNKLGLYDMSGNVWEWVNDWHDDNYYKNSPKNNPSGPYTGCYRIRRGGSWSSYAWFTRTSNRNRYTPDYRNSYLGFRLAEEK